MERISGQRSDSLTVRKGKDLDGDLPCLARPGQVSSLSRKREQDVESGTLGPSSFP